MNSLDASGSSPLARLAASAAYLLTLAGLLLAAASASVACEDTPGPPSGPGNVLIDDSMQDAVALLTQDGGYPPQGVGDGGDASPYLESGAGGSTGYQDVSSPQAACATCNCSTKVGFCLENGTSTTVTAAPYSNGACALAATGTPSVGCNPLPAACGGHGTCECVLDNLLLPTGCYAQCTDSPGYLDLYCPTP